jgi:hypothetical protein
MKDYLEIIEKKDKKSQKMFLSLPAVKKLMSNKEAEAKHPIEEFVEKKLK